MTKEFILTFNLNGIVFDATTIRSRKQESIALFAKSKVFRTLLLKYKIYLFVVASRFKERKDSDKESSFSWNFFFLLDFQPTDFIGLDLILFFFQMRMGFLMLLLSPFQRPCFCCIC